ncbi:hypothetical protein DFP72DRAFT_1092604 [Ephemerocybe angulata]|uniref:Uncharacterized protein n=1 Tax=Ephemerocybe angulata TaxID=980116 RepID=A0A8H6HF20_9AGAR|nr:hypothetical protein DFP72DRAFT_1092604 [Tulosesus angulatus]
MDLGDDDIHARALGLAQRDLMEDEFGTLYRMGHLARAIDVIPSNLLNAWWSKAALGADYANISKSGNAHSLKVRYPHSLRCSGSCRAPVVLGAKLGAGVGLTRYSSKGTDDSSARPTATKASLQEIYGHFLVGPGGARESGTARVGIGAFNIFPALQSLAELIKQLPGGDPGESLPMFQEIIKTSCDDDLVDIFPAFKSILAGVSARASRQGWPVSVHQWESEQEVKDALF